MCNTGGMKSYPAHEARLKMRDLLYDADHGQPSVITHYGKPAVMTVPFGMAVEWLAMLAAGSPNSPEARMLAEAKAVAAQAGEDAGARQ